MQHEERTGVKNTHSEIIPRLYMKLLPIQILLVIIGGLNSIIDNAFAANLLGSDAMAVTGLFSPVTNFLNAINVLVFGGAQVLCGKYLGKHMTERTGSIFSLDMVTIIMVSIMMMLACEVVPGPIAAALGASQELAGDLVCKDPCDLPIGTLAEFCEFSNLPFIVLRGCTNTAKEYNLIHNCLFEGRAWSALPVEVYERTAIRLAQRKLRPLPLITSW